MKSSRNSSKLYKSSEVHWIKNREEWSNIGNCRVATENMTELSTLTSLKENLNLIQIICRLRIFCQRTLTIWARGTQSSIWKIKVQITHPRRGRVRYSHINQNNILFPLQRQIQFGLGGICAEKCLGSCGSFGEIVLLHVTHDVQCCIGCGVSDEEKQKKFLQKCLQWNGSYRR